MKRLLTFGLILSVSLAAFALSAVGGTITLAWDPNSEPDLQGYKIYYGTSSRNYTVTLDVGNVTSYTVRDLDESKTYFFAVTAYDTAGNESDYSQEVSGRPKDTTAPTVTAVVAPLPEQVDVVFSEPVEKNSAENTANYSIEPGLRVHAAVLDQNGRVVHLTTDEQQDGRTYTLHVSGVRDRANPPNVIASGTSISYTFHAEDTQAPAIVKVELRGAEHLTVRFSEPVDRASAEDVDNYEIVPKVRVLAAKLDTSHTAVDLTTEPHSPGVTYTLKVKNIADLASPPNVVPDGTSYTYRYVPPLQFHLLSAGEYRAGYPRVGDPYYLDRDYVIEDVPDSLQGALWIQTAMSDKDNVDEEFLKFSVNQPVRVFVAYDSRVSTFPNWLQSEFTRTNAAIHVSGPADSLVLWRRDYSEGEIVLGGNRAAGASGPRDMYVVLLQPNSQSGSADPGEHESPGLGSGLPSEFVLHQNYPNPFNPETEIEFDVPETRRVKLTIYNLLGQKVRVLFDGEASPGRHRVVWDATDDFGRPVPGGAYFCRMEVVEIVDNGGLKVPVRSYASVRKMAYLR